MFPYSLKCLPYVGYMTILCLWFYHYVNKIHLQHVANQVIKDCVHGLLICYLSILEPKTHNHLFEYLNSSRATVHNLMHIILYNENLVISWIHVYKGNNFMLGSLVHEEVSYMHQVFIIRNGHACVLKFSHSP